MMMGEGGGHYAMYHWVSCQVASDLMTNHLAITGHPDRTCWSPADWRKELFWAHRYQQTFWNVRLFVGQFDDFHYHILLTGSKPIKHLCVEDIIV